MKEPELPRPRLRTLTLLVGRITTIKLAYWTALTIAEVALGLTVATFAQRFPLSLVIMAISTGIVCGWASVSARATDPRLGDLERSIPAVATSFMAASVVATPASLPLLFVEIQRAGEACSRGICHPEAIWYWVATVAIGTLVIPLVFALRMRKVEGMRT